MSIARSSPCGIRNVHHPVGPRVSAESTVEVAAVRVLAADDQGVLGDRPRAIAGVAVGQKDFEAPLGRIDFVWHRPQARCRIVEKENSDTTCCSESGGHRRGRDRACAARPLAPSRRVWRP